MAKTKYFEDNPMLWVQNSKCSQMDTGQFFDNFESAPVSDRRKIVGICEACPVRDECFQHARDNKEYGVWGGAWFYNGRPSNPLRKDMSSGRRKRAQYESIFSW